MVQRGPTSTVGLSLVGRIAARGCRRSGNAAASPPGTVLQYGYRDDAAVSGQLQVRMKPAKVSAETSAFVRLDRGKLDMHYQLDLHIRQGRLRQIGFTLPTAVGKKSQIVPLDSAGGSLSSGEVRCQPAVTARPTCPCGRLSWTGLWRAT